MFVAVKICYITVLSHCKLLLFKKADVDPSRFEHLIMFVFRRYFYALYLVILSLLLILKYKLQ